MKSRMELALSHLYACCYEGRIGSAIGVKARDGNLAKCPEGGVDVASSSAGGEEHVEDPQVRWRDQLYKAESFLQGAVLRACSHEVLLRNARSHVDDARVPHGLCGRATVVSSSEKPVKNAKLRGYTDVTHQEHSDTRKACHS